MAPGNNSQGNTKAKKARAEDNTTESVVTDQTGDEAATSETPVKKPLVSARSTRKKIVELQADEPEKTQNSPKATIKPKTNAKARGVQAKDVEVLSELELTAVEESRLEDDTEATELIADKDSDILLRPVGKAGAKHKTAVNNKKTQRRKFINPISAILNFLKEVWAEMKKVHWITKKQSIGYTIVVLVFVIATVAYISGLDVFFQYLLGLVFGDKIKIPDV